MAELIIIVALAALIIIGLCNPMLPKWFCEQLGWHLQPESVTFDGVNCGGKCPRCTKHVLRDSQGNWF